MAISFSLAGKTALVTGANTGIGQAIAVGLAQAGADVALAGRSHPAETLDLIAQAGRKAVNITADLASTAPVTRVVDEAVAALGRIDILVNNAGIIRRDDLLQFSEADWDAVIDTNLKTLFFLSQAAARGMVAQGSGKIINIASLLTFQGGIRVPSYAAAKSGVGGVTKAMANELAPHGVQVNAIAPGYIATNNTAALQADETRNRQILERIPAGRWGDPSDIAGAAVFLASPASNYVTGHVLAVDGGWLAR
ncbi:MULTISPECIES: 2-dehydro-3-deoxy-D-gluconate 5-dehydrogenase KduD [unclassified Novosphingobium]|uniref:2-dehydro-3-deoxy-D-gluconate 5-dehydrogenase KduD n=1 Tax=unclassified Novosphingobium TaxID=2644732 RepID=UPI0014941726|nr:MULTISPECIES: 2-dehydro-3-deoxy-D-gluconate 5-dehydrogenase KduD [unclassified Novosphingobium]MBB3357965.1 2-deoxy-D-gluconate 3-dehydrogenase [Novosphingobium sp. BK256]MBB3374326.1 2-deoxy-D-gluconate 3-dehydrogenase [Novosphingobium sp. BK280]MBB3378738.1 2-deoxy-D-gluconate 3-dehydrogenase [Novosphingobium sp. BK258]MBB3420432.1 2-deoxy-D-gluconate 3-dehydrogenase [Novosphingobium sp. BK267]MBB3448446.1 2-deoxy-D-gluconate 3-dehydrogenase [Novosphingobium sp. BK352]